MSMYEEGMLKDWFRMQDATFEFSQLVFSSLSLSIIWQGPLSTMVIRRDTIYRLTE